MQVIGNDELRARLDWSDLIEQLAGHLRTGDVEAPQRQVLPMALPGGGQASLLVMPVWVPGEGVMVKAVTYYPDNGQKGLPTIHAGAIWFNGEDGVLKAVCDADVLTARRTAAGSALAARYLARPDAAKLVIVGTGQLSADVAKAHTTQRHYSDIAIYGRSPDKAAAIVSTLSGHGVTARVAEDLEQACRQADVISSVTSATSPIIHGDWLQPGTHLDLIGAFRPDMREADDEAIRRASIFADTRPGALLSGELTQPVEAGVIAETGIRADLAELVRGEHKGRSSENEITLFKSAGFAVEDYAAMELAVSRA
ncbi:bifunctional Delta(1)-pyrroline-2-carboxylate/Delta(1)-piperideine-2-carboxylate reductase [Cucumibacter marinus]|uniref:ornithine cyclodeaminase family protein n=1 Tax=Cucumibacter marinus TaxID=1121252 RepID=UPI0004094356|nr:ornithine cyclodeaminase family protein [Cucumibacter marinus]